MTSIRSIFDKSEHANGPVKGKDKTPWSDDATFKIDLDPKKLDIIRGVVPSKRYSTEFTDK